MNLRANQNAGWRACLERFWSRAGLGALPAGDRFSSWVFTVDGVEINVSVTPDELGLLLRSRISVLRRDDKDYFLTIGKILRRTLGYMIGDTIAVRLISESTTVENLIAEMVFDPVRQSDDELDDIVTSIVDRALAYRRDFGSSPASVTTGMVTIVSSKQDNLEPEMIFRP